MPADFRQGNRPEEDDPYDVDFDVLLIEQSIATQYGVLPADQAELPYPEWAKLVGGLMDETPLGRVVAVRSEQDRKVIAKMSPWQRKIRSDWQAFKAKKMRQQSTENLRAQMADLERMLAAAFGGGKSG